MKLFAFVSLLILSLTFTTFGQKTKSTKTTTTKTTTTTVSNSAADEKAVRQTFEDLLTGIRASSVDTVTGVYWNSPQTLYFNSNGSITIGWDQDRKNRESRYPRTSNVKLDASQVRVSMLGSEGALVTCLWKQTQDFDANSETAAGRMTLVFKKIGKDWKVIHLHTSPTAVPADRPLFPSERERQ
jgi:ketosteroid isomerase-like protein